MKDEVAPIVALHDAMASDLGRSIGENKTILDFGCGIGGTVEAFRAAGRNAYGVDMGRDLETAERRIRAATGCRTGDRLLRQLETNPYRLPFDDSTFDYVFSEEVFEHVTNHDDVLRELWRVMKPGGFSLHFFPSRWRPIESHVYVPFGGVFQNEPYLRIWSLLGIRNEFQRGLGWREVAKKNADYLSSGTNYLTKQEIEEKAARTFDRLSWEELSFTRRSFGRSRCLYPILRTLPPLLALYRTFHTRVLCLQK